MIIEYILNKYIKEWNYEVLNIIYLAENDIYLYKFT